MKEETRDVLDMSNSVILGSFTFFILVLSSFPEYGVSKNLFIIPMFFGVIIRLLIWKGFNSPQLNAICKTIPTSSEN